MKLGFCREWIDLMLLCVKSVRFNLLVNDELIGPIVPHRGLRQGDPLSPYLFILCAEGLSSLISRSEAVGSLHGCKVSRGATIVSHLFFANDAYLFFRATMEECRRVKEILQCYQKASGQAVNFNKSAASFSTCVGAEIRALLCGELGVKEVVDDGSYLGMPASVGRKKKALFAYVNDRVWAKIQNWKNRPLSKAGKEILLKTVLQAMPNYVMSLFKLPSDTCDELEKIFNGYWWGNQEGKGGIRWCRWDILCNQKKDGGMSFRKLSDFNLALLAKQGWRILTNPTCLMVRILKARYFKNSEFLSSDLGDNPSYIWRSIWAAKGTLVSGCRWRVGDGKSIKIWGDPWLQDTVSARISSPQVFGGENMLVEELISECGTSWNVEKINELLDVPDVMKVLDIPLSVRKHVDCWMWTAYRKGKYTVRSGYGLLRRQSEVPQQQQFHAVWKLIWQLNAPPKVVNFMWRAARDLIPTRYALFQKRLLNDASCPICGNGVESTLHVLVSCSFAQEVWLRSGLGYFLGNIRSFKEWFFTIAQHVEVQRLAEMSSICWGIWRHINDLVWNHKHANVQKVISGSLGLLRYWLHVRVDGVSSVAGSAATQPGVRWDSPPLGWLKYNVDAATFPEK